MREEPPLDLDRPRDAGELVATTLRLFGRHSGLFLSVTLLVVAHVVIVVDGMWDRGLTAGSNLQAGGTAAAIAGAVADLAMPVLVTALHVAVVRALGDGRVPALGDALRSAAPRFPAAVGATLAYAALATLGCLALIVPGVWLLVAGYFCAQVAVTERRGPFGAVRRSIELVRGRWWPTAGTLLLAWFLLLVVFLPLDAAVGAVHAGLPYVVLLTVVRALDLSLSALFGTLLYFSLRARDRQPVMVA